MDADLPQPHEAELLGAAWRLLPGAADAELTLRHPQQEEPLGRLREKLPVRPRTGEALHA